MTISTILFILIIHWLADFVLQTDWMAQNKHDNFEALGAHFIVYTLTIMIAALFFTLSPMALIWALANGMAHLCIDYVTSKINTSLWHQGRVHDFFVNVGLDQLLHYTILILTWNQFL